MPSLQCLFCQHINPSDADDCRRCDGQLNLQPCRRCGAIDLRTATNCYKCGAKFSLPVAPRLDVPFAPAIVDKEPTYPTLVDIGVSHSEVGQLDAGLTYAHPERQPVAKVISPEKSDTTAKLQRGTPVAVLAIVLLLITAAAAAYFFLGNTAQPARILGQEQAATDGSGAGKTGEPAPSNGAAGRDAASKPMGSVQTPPVPAPDGVGAVLATSPLPATDAETKTARDQSIVEKCPPAVATLGLCNPDPRQEKP